MPPALKGRVTERQNRPWLGMTFLAWPLLGERITFVRMASVVIGFAGVMIVIRPGRSVFQWASLMMLASAIFYAGYQVVVRRVAAADSPAADWCDLAMMVSLGISGGFGHYCVARAFSYAPANLIAPLNYTQMIGSVAVGYLMFAESPDVYTWLGSAVIIAAGLLVGWQSRKRT